MRLTPWVPNPTCHHLLLLVLLGCGVGEELAVDGVGTDRLEVGRQGGHGAARGRGPVASVGTVDSAYSAAPGV